MGSPLEQITCPSCGSYEFVEEIRHPSPRLGIIMRGGDGLRFERVPHDPHEDGHEEWWEPRYLCADCGNAYLYGTGGTGIPSPDR